MRPAVLVVECQLLKYYPLYCRWCLNNIVSVSLLAATSGASGFSSNLEQDSSSRLGENWLASLYTNGRCIRTCMSEGGKEGIYYIGTCI